MIRIYEIPFSTNVERVSLALAHKGLEAEAVTMDAADRSEIQRVSGQDLVPVLDHDGRIVVDSPVILAYLEEHFPEPPLYPADPARRAEVETFVDWFNLVWKRWPNEINDGVADRSRELAASRDRFEAMLDGREHLMGDFGVADCVAFPFLKYGLLPPAADDPDSFHLVLAEHLRLGDGYPRLREWIRRVDERPRAL
ncbi:MAG TPA: glutathione S-transferase family protein [Solirubrobacteraceae bacterium]|nr:glutathione S-transferase family protein [Solirubrobacteraceae bacterium]